MSETDHTEHREDDESRRRRRSRSRSPARESDHINADDTDAGEDVGGLREKEIHRAFYDVVC